jgi:hypothetical protein
VEVSAARPSVLPEEAVAAQPVSAAAEVLRQEVAEVRPALAVPQQEVEARSALAAAARRPAVVAAERLASAERQQEAAAQPARGARAARLRAAVPSAAACSCHPAAAPARRRSTRFVPVTARLRIASP